MAEKDTTDNTKVDSTADKSAPADKSTVDQGGEAAASASNSEPHAPSDDATEGAEKVSVGADSAPAADKEPAADDKARGPQDWKAKKYDKVFAQLQEAKAALAAKETAPGADGKPGLSEADVEARAQAKAVVAEFNRQCNTVAEIAKKAFPDFPKHIENMRQLVTDNDERAAYNAMVSSALELGDEEAGRVLYALGGDLDEAHRIMSIKSPAKQALELAKLAQKKGEPEPSGAPKPITPVGQRGATGEQIAAEDPNRADKLSKKDWMARREAHIAKLREQGVRIW